jgi:hypothetical protein
MKLLRWKRFSWDLNKLPVPAPPLAERYTLRAATPEDLKTVAHLIHSCFSLDSAWGDALALIKDWMAAQIDAAFVREAVPAVVISHGTRIIAASAISTDVAADTNLLSGPCVAIVKENTPAGKFVYPKFNSTSDEIEFEPRLVGT